MSALPISLNSKPVVAGVLALLAVVAVVNVAYFKPGSKAPRRAEVRVQTAQRLPLDLGDVQRGSTAPNANLAAWSQSKKPALARDPFGRRKAAVVATGVVDKLVTPEKPAGPEPLQCNAVLMGGGHPAALINGKTYRVGDSVRQYGVVAIGAQGVKLSSATGDAVFLSVYSDRQGAGSSRIVNGINETARLGRTSLVEHARGERK